jgi:MFS family permease
MAEQQAWPPGAARAEWRAHWVLVLASFVGFSLIGVISTAMGAFIAPLETQFHWSRAEVTSGLTVLALTSIVGQPFVGRLIDRFGPRPVALTGIVTFGAAMVLLSTATGSMTNWLLLWLGYALAGQLVMMSVWSAAVANTFEAGRGLALALTLSGSAAISIVTPIAATSLIAADGWRTAFAVMGAVPSAVAFVLVYLFFGRQDRRSGKHAADAAAAEGASLGEALRSPVFQKLFFSILVSFIVMMGTTIHAIPILSSSGLTREQAAAVAATVGIGGIIGKVLCGLLVTRLPNHLIMATLMLFPVVGCLMLLSPSDSVALRIVAIGFLGLPAGGQVKMLAYLTARRFGLRAFGSIVSILGTAVTVGTGLGPLVAGFIFDQTHSYRLLLIGGAPVSVLLCLLVFTIGDGLPAARPAVALGGARP